MIKRGSFAQEGPLGRLDEKLSQAYHHFYEVVFQATKTGTTMHG